MTLTEQPLDVAPIEPPVARQRGSRRSVVVVTLLVAAVLALLSQGLLHNLNYFETVDSALAHRHSLGTSDFRLEGVVAKGTVVRTSSGATFYLDGNRPREVFVVALGEPPQLFQASIPVVVDGHFLAKTHGSTVVFEAHQIIVKHSADYKAQHPGRVRAPDGSTR